MCVCVMISDSDSSSFDQLFFLLSFLIIHSHTVLFFVLFCFVLFVVLVSHHFQSHKDHVRLLADHLLLTETLNMDDVVKLIGRRPFAYTGIGAGKCHSEVTVRTKTKERMSKRSKRRKKRKEGKHEKKVRMSQR